MKKTLLGVAVAVGAVALISPKIIADKTDARLNQIVTKINSIPGYKASVVDTKQSWFNSSTTLNIGFDAEAFDPAMATNSPESMSFFEDLNIDVLVNMQHGPVLMNKGLGLSDIQVSIPNTSDNVKDGDNKVDNIYLFDGKLNLLGDLSYTDTFSAMQVAFPELGGEFVFSGYRGKGETVQGDINYTGSSTSIEVISPNLNLKMSDISTNWVGEFDLAKMMKGIYGNSESNFIIGNFEATQAAQKLFGWEGLELFAITAIDESNLLDMQGGYRVNSMDTPIEKFEDIEITFELNNLDQAFMDTYYDVIMPLQAPNADPQAILNQLKAPVINLLSHQPELKITNIGFKTATGAMKSNATLKLAEYDINETQLEDASFWQNNLLFDSGMDLPKALALDLLQKNIMMQLQADPGSAGYTPQQLQDLATQQAEMTLDGFVQGGFLTEENGQLVLAFNVANGMANLNGNDIPLSALIPAQ